MTERLSTGSYLILVFVNIFISIPAILSMGMFFERSLNIDEAMLRLDSFKRNQSKIFQYIVLNCSQVLNEYPEFEVFPRVDLCTTYNLSLSLGKLAVLSSTLFNTYLPYGLYGPPLLPVMIMGTTSILLFYTHFTNDERTILLLESTLIVAGYLMIIGQYLLPNLDNHLKEQWSKIKKWLSKDNEHIYDNIHNEDDTHQD